MVAGPALYPSPNEKDDQAEQNPDLNFIFPSSWYSNPVDIEGFSPVSTSILNPAKRLLFILVPTPSCIAAGRQLVPVNPGRGLKKCKSATTFSPALNAAPASNVTRSLVG